MYLSKIKIKDFRNFHDTTFDFDEILYLSYVLIKEYRHIRFLLQYQFPYVFVDEYQDTNPLQNAIIKLFADCNSCTWGVVGDLAQSIYGFAGATYKEFESYNNMSKETLEYSIIGNRRSTEKITRFISYIRQKDIFIPKQECMKNIGECKPVTVLLHSSEQDRTRYLPKGIMILCRSSSERFAYIDGISQEQQKALKAISDTYQFAYGNDMYNEIENNYAEWIKLCAFVVQIKKAAESKCMASMIAASKDILDIELMLKPSVMQADYYNKFLVLIKKVMSVSQDCTFVMMEKSINEWLIETEMLIATFAVPKLGEDNYNEKLYSSINKLEYNTIEKMVLEVFSSDSKLMTIHKENGLEFDKVMVNIEPFSSEKKLFNYIDIIKNPLLFSTDSKLDKATEYARVVYVGLSRAINELYLYIRTAEPEKVEKELETAFSAYMEQEKIIDKF